MTTITVRIDKRIKNRLEKLAKATSRNKSYLVTHAIEDYLEVNEWQTKEIKDAIKEADTGHLIDHDTVLKKWEFRLENTMD
ncbi:MAG: ribbon-helix-helix protein, CopG family [Deltaproteobacteria bacterium]|nr:ribbon-helix-helix protein, CopG family [Deltaproteobacteria bacterium]